MFWTSTYDQRLSMQNVSLAPLLKFCFQRPFYVGLEISIHVLKKFQRSEKFVPSFFRLFGPNSKNNTINQHPSFFLNLSTDEEKLEYKTLDTAVRGHRENPTQHELATNLLREMSQENP